jgi:hypothetical protein
MVAVEGRKLLFDRIGRALVAAPLAQHEIALYNRWFHSGAAKRTHSSSTWSYDDANQLINYTVSNNDYLVYRE